MSSNPRARFGYLNYDDIIIKLNNKQLDAFDVVFTKDTKETIIISDKLELIPIQSRVLIFKNTAEAILALNEDSSTYEGQIVSILNNDVYSAYIVNKDYKDSYYVTPLNIYDGVIDYNSLGNKPITNLVGTLDNNIIIDELDNGIYSVSGLYKISTKCNTLFSTTYPTVFLVDKSDEINYVKKITAKEIINYSISDVINTSTIVTSEYLESKGYVASDYVDAKIAALNFLTKDELDTYVASSVSDAVDTALGEELDNKIDQKINQKLQNSSISREQIESLFST